MGSSDSKQQKTEFVKTVGASSAVMKEFKQCKSSKLFQ